MKCSKCNSVPNESEQFAWRCNSCKKVYKVSLKNIQCFAEKKQSGVTGPLLKCKECGAPLDDGNETIAWKCSCGNVQKGKLGDFLSVEKEEIMVAGNASDIIHPNLIRCPECGKEISDSVKKCIHCGYAVKVEKRNKKIPLLIGMVLIALIIVFCEIRLLDGRNAGYYDDNKWGTTYDDIKNKYGEDISESYLSSGALAMYKEKFNGVEGIYVMIQFEFDKNGGLDTVLLMVSNAQSDMSDSEVYNMIIDGLTESYGNGEKVDYGLSWETEKSIIAAKQYPGSTDGTMIMYNKKGE